MAIDKNSNGFTFGFAIIMVVLVGAILAVAAMALKPAQSENIKREKMKDILAAIQLDVTMEEAPNAFQDYVKERLVIDYSGKVISSKTGSIDPASKEGDAFYVKVKKEFRSINNPEDRNYPLFICEKDGKKYYVIPMVGKGLWGPIWGYVSVESDYKTIFGASFDHKTETPGLGAEIKEDFFEKQFSGEEIKSNGDFTEIKVVKGNSDPSNKHAVDGITGGTITSVGVQEMVNRTLAVYNTYFTKAG